MSALLTGNKKATLDVRQNDLYESPPEAVSALLGVERIPHRVWEPACGPGVIVSMLRSRGHDVLATDLVDYGSPHQDKSGIDFLIPGIAESINTERRAIVTNPPFKNAREFVIRALQMTDYVAMLLRLAFLESEGRRDIIDNSCLARVHVFRKRLPTMHRAGFEGNRTGSAMAFAWFVWDKKHSGPVQLHRVSWEEWA